MIYEDLYRFYKDNRTIIFDLDNTIYDEDKYLFGVYKKISNTQKIYDHMDVYKFLSDEYRNSGRLNLFDKLVNSFPKLDLRLNEMLQLMRAYDGSYFNLDLNKWFLDFLNSVNSDFIIRIITNGNITQQKNKINLLNIKNLGFETDIVFANEYGKKPNKNAFRALAGSEYFFSPIYVGDSEVDKLFSKNSNIDFYHV